MASSIEIPNKVTERLERAKGQIREGATLRNECLAMWRGEQYVRRTDDGQLVQQATTLGSKPNHRPRFTRNLIHGLVEGKVSQATQRIPSYEVAPSSTDPEDISAARLSEKLALFGYDKWKLRRVAVRCFTSAFVTDGGFAMPYWDATAPPILDPDSGLGMGEIKIRTFTGNEVGWEPGVDFYDSPYHVVQQARLVDEVEAMPGFIRTDKGEGVFADATSHEILNTGNFAKSAHSRLVMVYEYLERPCGKYPEGRRLVIANDRLILPEESYPCAAYGYDGVAIHPIFYTEDPDNDRGRGLVVHLLDAQRTYNTATNQQIAWAQLALNPQIIGPPMSNKVKFTDEPGAYITVIPVNGMTPQWRDVPPIPPELSQMKLEAKSDMWEIAAAEEIPDGVEAAKGITAAIELARARWAHFLTAAAEFHSHLMSHCLCIAQHYYVEPRLIKYTGRFGPDRIADFLGADLCDQTDVRVLPGSFQARSQEAIEQRVFAYADRQWIPPEAAMAAIAGGTAEKLIESYELDVARANLMIQKIKAGPEVLFAEPIMDPMQPPSWAPRKFDNIAVHMAIFQDYMKTQEYDALDPPMQEAMRLYYDACEFLQQQKQIQMAMQQEAMAQSLGMANASAPQRAAPTPDQRKPDAA